MKRKKWLYGGFAVVLIGCMIAGRLRFGTKPFRRLSVDDISNATAQLLPPGISLAMNEEETKTLVKILNKVVIYGQDNSHMHYAGQAAAFTITTSDGASFEVVAYNPFIIIDGVGYQTKYGPCAELSNLANQLESGKEG